MRRLTIVFGALALFGAGFFLGHYTGIDTAADKSLPELGSKNAGSSGAAQGNAGPSGAPAENVPPALGMHSAVRATPREKTRAVSFSSGALRAPELVLTPEEQADLLPSNGKRDRPTWSRWRP